MIVERVRGMERSRRGGEAEKIGRREGGEEEKEYSLARPLFVCFP